MQIKRTALVLIAILAIAPLILAVCFYSALPDEIVMQWGFNGSVDYRPKAQLLMMSALSPVLAIAMLVTPKIDPRGQNYKRFGSTYQGLIIVVLAFLLMMNAIVISEAFYPGKISVHYIVTIGVGLLFIFLGNMLPKVKSNFYVGIKTPWTISDPDVWFKTNRLGGYMFFACGFVLCAAPFILSEKMTFAVIIAVIAAVAIIPTVMSYIWYRQKNNDPTEM